ncbi:MAG TPA: DNA helicase UvrD, partial [Aggregicoccus sp.]|nr:DNA helicase UvrD [Aggregicoccus sp.]
LRSAGRVLASAWARSVGEGALHRRLPYALVLDEEGPGLTLEGQVDLLREVPGGGAELLLYAEGARPAAGLEACAQELAALRLAAHTLLPAAARVRVGVLFLDEPQPEPEFLAPGGLEPGEGGAAALEALAGALRECARALLAAEADRGT